MFGLSPLPRTLDAALRDLTHAKFTVRLSAVRDLAKLARTSDAASAQAALVRALSSDEAPGIRAEAALALADAEARGTVSDLLAAANDEHPRVRQMVLLALGELCDADQPDIIALLEKARRAEEPEVRFQALLALHRIAADDIVNALVDGTRDTDAEVRHIAYRCAEERWGNQPDSTCPAVIVQRARAALRDESIVVRLAAAILLARLGDDAGADVIVQVVAGPSRVVPPEDEQAAIELCGELSLKSALRALERRAFGVFGVRRDSFAWHARIALARLGHERAKQFILKGLYSWSRDARTLAVAAAGRAELREAHEIIVRMSGDAERADPDTVRETLALLSAKVQTSEHSS